MVTAVTHLRDHTAVCGSVSETQVRLESYLAAQRGGNGVARFRLRVPLDGPAHGISLDREVRIEAWRDRDDQNLNDLIRIRWTPEGTVVFPRFSGTLVVWGDENPEVSYIELDGEYKPPLGATGQLFDEVIGHRLAEATAREFLRDVKDGIESQLSS
jgi:hypothetical protein